MRADMAKVIVERPRRGGGRARPGRTAALEDDDGAPLRARAPKKPRADKTKYLNENLAPLRRFLEGQVGRPWDKVYAEIAANLKPANTVQQHVRDHVEDFVAVRTRMKDGAVFVGGQDRRGGFVALKDSYARLYVHPRTGLLRENPNYRSWRAAAQARAAAKAAALSARMKEIAPLVQLHLLKDGAWWEVKLARIKTHAAAGGGRAEEPYCDTVRAAGLSTLPRAELYGREGVYGAEKRQLRKAEKKRLGII